LQSVGAISEGSLQNALGINDAEVGSALAELREKQEAVATLREGNLSQLNPIGTYNGSVDDTESVLQGEGKIISPDSDANGLFSFGAGPCVYLVAVAKDDGGNVTNVGLAHVDAAAPESNISSFLSRTRGDAENLEISLISGDDESAWSIYNAAQDNDAGIVFSHIDSSASEGIAVDKEGNIYYGNRMELAKPMDPLAFSAHTASRNVGTPLSISEH